MYIYAFDWYAGTDRIYKYTWELKVKPWDLLAANNTHFLVLWDDIMFMELYTYQQSTFASYQIVHKQLIDSRSIEMIHRLVYTYYSSYKNVIPLFFPWDIGYLLAKKPNKVSKPSADTIIYNPISQKCEHTKEQLHSQELWIFPDIRTMYNITTQKQRDTNIFRHSKLTPLQKVRTFRQIHMQSSDNYLTTYAGIFQNRKNLTHIHMFYPHKRYYAHQQDPKYKTQEVVKKLTDIYNIPVSYIQE